MAHGPSIRVMSPASRCYQPPRAKLNLNRIDERSQRENKRKNKRGGQQQQQQQQKNDNNNETTWEFFGTTKTWNLSNTETHLIFKMRQGEREREREKKLKNKTAARKEKKGHYHIQRRTRKRHQLDNRKRTVKFNKTNQNKTKMIARAWKNH